MNIIYPTFLLLTFSSSLPNIYQNSEQLSRVYTDEIHIEPPAIIAKQSNQRLASFNSQFLDAQLIKYQKFVEISGPPDILIVGSSRAAQGIDPAILQQALASQNKGQLKIFNFGINGATAQVVELLLTKILTPQQMPKMIIWADGARAFNSGRIDRTYDAIISSEGYKQITTASPPNQKPATTPSPGNSTPSYRPMTIPPGRFNSDPINFLPQEPTEFLSSKQQKKPTTTQPKPNPTLDYQINGFNPVPNRFDPKTYYQKFKQIAGQYDGDYANFNLTGEQTNALQQIINQTKSQRIPLVIINLPLSKDYLDKERQKREQEFVQFISKQANNTNLIFRDFSNLWPTEYNYFADPSHLNQNGAAAVARQLAQTATIPWPVAKK